MVNLHIIEMTKIIINLQVWTLSLILIGCSASKKVQSNNNDAKPNYQIEVNTRLAEVDNLGRLYVVDDRNRLINYKPDLTEQYQFADKKSGLISTIDVTNPLRIIVFYDDFNKINILDNTLSLITDVVLVDKFADVSAAAVTNDGNLWVYDPVQFKLIKIDDSGSKILETSNVNDFGMQYVKIESIREKGNYVVLCDKGQGFYIFDNLGQYQFHYAANDIKHWNFDGRNINYFTSTGLKNFSVKYKERIMIGTPFGVTSPEVMYIIWSGGDYFEINKNGINVVRGDKVKEDDPKR